MRTISPETQAIMKFDAVWQRMLKDKPFEAEFDRVCESCGQRKRAVLVSKTGITVCMDCMSNPASAGCFGIATRHPQGDQLLRLPSKPPFVKKFT